MNAQKDTATLTTKKITPFSTMEGLISFKTSALKGIFPNQCAELSDKKLTLDARSAGILLFRYIT